jgi:hypothetical protein
MIMMMIAPRINASNLPAKPTSKPTSKPLDKPPAKPGAKSHLLLLQPKVVANPRKPDLLVQILSKKTLSVWHHSRTSRNDMKIKSMTYKKELRSATRKMIARHPALNYKQNMMNIG